MPQYMHPYLHASTGSACTAQLPSLLPQLRHSPLNLISPGRSDVSRPLSTPQSRRRPFRVPTPTSYLFTDVVEEAIDVASNPFAGT